MTPQEIFDTVARHLFTQGERAGIVLDDDPDDIGRGFSCRYRAPGGATCAVGRLLPDDAYDPGMEGNTVDMICDAYADLLPAWMFDHHGLLDRLQRVHDTKDHWISDERMRWELSLAAEAYELDDSILPGLSFNRPEQEAV
jgi:hypothetical protein